MVDSDGDVFPFNRYFVRHKRNVPTKLTTYRIAAIDVNANEHCPSATFEKNENYSNGDSHKARIYYDFPLCLNSSGASQILPKVDSVTYKFRKTVRDTLSRSSHAKLPNCLRKKQQAFNSKFADIHFNSMTSFSDNVGQTLDQSLESSFQNLLEPSFNDELYHQILIGN